MIVASVVLLAQLQASLPSSAMRYDAPVAVTRAWSLPGERAAIAAAPVALDTPVVQRPRAVEYSDTYYARLTIHRYTSYAMLPLFAAEYSLGQNLINDTAPPSWLKPAHAAVASGIGIVFSVNTVTGLWNLWEAREDPDGRTRRTVHSILMLVSDAGFLATAGLTPEREEGFSNFTDYQHRVNVHRGVAIGSFALSTIGGAMMWFWK